MYFSILNLVSNCPWKWQKYSQSIGKGRSTRKELLFLEFEVHIQHTNEEDKLVIFEYVNNKM